MTHDDAGVGSGPLRPDELRTLFLLESLDDEQLDWFARNGEVVQAKAGEDLYGEDEPAACFYQLMTGTIAMYRKVSGVEVEIVRSDQRGAYAGATSAWLTSEVERVYATRLRAITDVTLLAVPAEGFGRFMHDNFPMAVHLLEGLVIGMRNTQQRVGERQRLLALGSLAAGLTHELNNPAAAAVRAVETLRARVAGMRDKLAYLADGHLSAQVLHELVGLQEEALELSASAPRRTALESSDAEDELTDWLDDNGLRRVGVFAPVFVAAGLDRSWAEKVQATLSNEDLASGLAWVGYSLETESLMSEITDSVQRISQLVGAAKRYSQLDRTPFQHADLREGLESTLVMLGAKLGQTTVVRDYDPDLPLVPSYPAELNQVWTNLIDNAVQAMGPGGTLTLRTARDGEHALVSVEDTGPGVPPELVTRIFEPFFTTKPVGEGTGLGLDISYRVVTVKHRGDLRVVSEPGRTRFEVRLPLVEPDVVD